MAFIVIIIIIKKWYGLRHLFWNFEVQFNKKNVMEPFLICYKYFSLAAKQWEIIYLRNPIKIHLWEIIIIILCSKRCQR